MSAATQGQAPPAGNRDSGKERDRLLVATHAVLNNCGVTMSPSRVGRLVRRFQERVERNGFGFGEFLANTLELDADTRRRVLANPELQRVISYSDRTGETAANNVDRERGH